MNGLSEEMKIALALADHLGLVIYCEDENGRVAEVNEDRYARNLKGEYIYHIRDKQP